MCQTNIYTTTLYNFACYEKLNVVHSLMDDDLLNFPIFL